MRYPLIMGHLMSRPWAMRADTMRSFAQIMHAAEHGRASVTSVMDPSGTTSMMERRSMRLATLHPDARRSSAVHYTASGQEPAQQDPCIAVIPMHGVIAKYLDRGACESGFDLQDFDRDLTAAANDPAVTSIVIHAHTPGGSCVGVAETANRIAYIADNIKPVYLYTDSDCCSAGYWMGCACTSVIASEMACVGSIGVYLAWIDQARWMEAEGYDLKLFKAGTFKAATLPGQLSDEMGQLLQAEVDSIAASFYAWVRERRSKAGATVEDATMQGQTFLGRDAVSVGLVDGLYNSLDDLLIDLLNSTKDSAA